MEPFRGMAIGIDHYCHLPPLDRAEADAQAFYRGLHYWGGIPHSQLVLLGDTSPQMGDRLTIPQRATILQWLAVQTVPVERYWFFFKGYGANYRGDDYLMPIDGDPNDIAKGGILVRSLFERLQQLCSQQLLILLDLTRLPEGSFVGEQTLRLAQQQGIALILACQTPNTETFRQELWVNALLEALRYYRHHLTLAQLDAYFRDRLSEGKTPIVISPNLTAARVPLLPSPPKSQLQWQSFDRSQIQTEAIPPIPLKKEGGKRQSPRPPLKRGEARESNSGFDPSQQVKLQIEAIGGNFGVVASQSQKAESSFSPQLFIPPTPNTNSLNIYDTSEGKGDRNSPLPFSISETNRDQAHPIQNPILPPTSVKPTAKPPLTPFLRGDQGEIKRADQKGKSSKTQNNIGWLLGMGTVLLGTVLGWQWLVVQSPIAKQEVTEVTKDNQQVLYRSRVILSSQQASRLNQAISIARQIPVDAPLYEEAQSDITRWSHVILDIAYGRATRGDLTGAIAAARLVPADRSSLYSLAQQAIEDWQNLAQQQQDNWVLIEAAKALIQRYRASSYNQAIATVRRLLPGEPGYVQARELTQQWSDRIYQLARMRAAQGKLSLAIQTAQLVPEDTAAYAKARTAIAEWQQKLRR